MQLLILMPLKISLSMFPIRMSIVVLLGILFSQAQDISSTALIGDWTIAARISDGDTLWCDEKCGTIQFGDDYVAHIVSAQEQELSFRWLITNQILNFYDYAAHRRKKKGEVKKIPGKFIITDRSNGEGRNIILTHTTDNYAYYLLPTVILPDSSTH